MKLHTPSGLASATISAHAGGRVASLIVDGMELLASDSAGGPLAWGCYAMVPWAGRIRNGEFTFRGASYALAKNLGNHAIHGVGFDQPWDVLGGSKLGIDLAASWPFGGRATQSFAITDNALRMTVSVEAGDQAMPVVLGWHPCLRRELTRGGPGELSFNPKWMWHRAADGIPDGTRVSPSLEPWDDAFGGVTAPPQVRWPGAMQLSLEADCPTWVVYTERTDQLCVEPQTGIPNAFNFDDPQVLEAGKSMELTLTVRWTGFPASRVGHTGYMTGTPKDPQEPQPSAESAHDAELGAYDLDGDGKISMVESERARLGLVDARLEEIAEEGGIKGKLADAAHHVLDKLDND